MAAACRQGIWREKRIQTRRRGMSERSNTLRSFASRDYSGRKNVMGKEKGERTEGPMGLCGTLARRSSSLVRSCVVRIFLPCTDTPSPSALFLDEYTPVGGINPSPVTTYPPPSTSTTTAIHQGCGGDRHGRRVIFKTPLAGK